MLRRLSGAILGAQVREQYPLSGEQRRHRRRDLRRGSAQGSAGFRRDGALRVDLTWDPPHGGSGHDVFVLQDVTTLRVESVITVDGRTVSYNIIYRRRM